MRTLAVVAMIGVPGVATAETRASIGASAGVSQGGDDADQGIDASKTLGVWGRLALSKRVSGQLEIARSKEDYSCSSCSRFRAYNALLVIDLRAPGPWMPTAIVGGGLDRNLSSSTEKGSHVECGLGVEYHAGGGFMIGADARIGARSVDEGPQFLNNDVAFANGPTSLRDGTYHAVQLTVGLRFK